VGSDKLEMSFDSNVNMGVSVNSAKRLEHFRLKCSQQVVHSNTLRFFLTLYCNPDWQSALESQQFATFEQIWDSPIDWIDEPNRNRGGWSGVGRMQMLKHGERITLYVKKQQNHVSRSLVHPFKGEPTFAKEFSVIRYLSLHGVMVPRVVFFGQRSVKAGQQAILITENLESFHALNEISTTAMSLISKRTLVATVAQAIKNMHAAGIQHRALYPKHVFVKPLGDSFAVGFIDLEKSRKMIFPWLQSISDLITLNYRTTDWGLLHRMYFFTKYFSITRLNKFYRTLYRWIAYKTKQKQQQWNSKK
jgi:hypothetical protein